MADMKSICVHCGKPEEDHCIGFERTMPEGCQCAPGEWGERVTPICDKFVGEGSQYCRICEHDKGCHR